MPDPRLISFPHFVPFDSRGVFRHPANRLHSLPSILFWLYVLSGPVAVGVTLYLILIGRERMLKLVKSRAELPSDAPKVSILIPAKDEAFEIRTCIERVQQQDYPDFEVIAINDRSADATGALLDDFASLQFAASCRNTLKIVHVEALPDGWLGKCHALHEGIKHATGDWLLFVDSDVRLEPDALRKALALAVERNYDALSILTTIRCEIFWERLLLPPLAGVWASMFAIDQTNEDSETDKAAANGQFFLIRASAYHAVGGHERVKRQIVEDVELMRALKAAGHKVRFLAGGHLAATRMHTTLRHVFHGWARIYAGSARGSVWPMVRGVLVLLISWLSVYGGLIVASITRDEWWLGASVLHWALLTVVISLVYRWSGNRARYAVLFPLTGAMLLAILIFSIRRAISGKVDWRGSSLTIRA